jgi:hypothetical protein
VLEQDPKQTNKQKVWLTQMTKPYLGGQRKMDFLKADRWIAFERPPTKKQGEKHKDNKKKESKSALFLIC